LITRKSLGYSKPKATGADRLMRTEHLWR